MIMAIWSSHRHRNRDHGQLPRSTSMNLAFRICFAVPAWQAAMIMAGFATV
jgi:hypothetical protein